MGNLLLQLTGRVGDIMGRGARAAFQRRVIVEAELISIAVQTGGVFQVDEALLREPGELQTRVPSLKSMPRGGS